jgi:hypothetical protein
LSEQTPQTSFAMNPTLKTHNEKSVDRRSLAQRTKGALAKAALGSMASLVVLAAAMVFCTGLASASQRRVFTVSFGGASSTTVDPYPLSNVRSCSDNQTLCPKVIAVDTTTGRPSSGDIYVGDPNNGRVEKFSPSGDFILMFGKNVDKTKVEEAGSTEAERDVCTAASLDTCQQGAEGTTPGAFVGKALSVAVDDSTGPSAGDVYVGNTTKSPVNSKGLGAGEGAITKFDEDGQVVSSWGVGGKMLDSGQAFGAVGGVTVDHSGNLWVSGTIEEEQGSHDALVFELSQAGSLITSWQPAPKVSTNSFGEIGVDEEHHVYLSVETDETREYEEGSGKSIGLVVPGFDPSSGTKTFAQFFALDLAAKMIYFTAEIQELGSGGGPAVVRSEILDFPFTCPPGRFGCMPIEAFRRTTSSWGPLAVNSSVPSDTLYVDERGSEGGEPQVVAEAIETVPGVTSLPAAPVSGASAALNGTVNPEGVAIAKCFFEWGESGKPYENEAPCESPGAAGIGSGSSPVAVHAQLSIQTGKSYHFRLVAANANDVHEPVQGADVLLGPPRVDGSSVVEVTASSVTFQAEVNPQNLESRYHFEYLTEAEFDENGESFSGPHPATSVPLTDAALGVGQVDVPVSRHVTGLLLHTMYRYRIVTQNRLGEGTEAVDGPAEAFSTWGTGEFGLPDGRQWEMVSPPDKHGALVEPIGEDWLIQAAAGGGRMAYVTRAPTDSNPAGYALYQSVLATRGNGGGWSSRDLAIPHIAPTGLSVGQGWEYRFFTEDLARTIVQPFGPFVPCESEQGAAQPCLSPEASEQTAFLAADYTGDSSERCTESCYTPLVTGAEGYADVPPETVFGQTSVFGHPCPPFVYCGPAFEYATPDANHVLLQSPVALAASPSAKAVIPPGSMYEWNAGRTASERLRLVSVLPGNGSGEALPASGVQLGYHEGNARHVISDDGTRVVFGAAQNNQQHLYLRENATEQQSPIGEHGECLVAADACTVQLDAGLPASAQFQTANRAVTRIFFTEDSNGAEEGDLYEYDVQQGTLVAMTENAHVVGSVIGASEDGSWMYFVATAALAPHATTDRNLYEMHYSGVAWEAPRLVAALSSVTDETDWTHDAQGYSDLAARVSPNGEWLAFMSTRRLTGFDNSDRTSGEADSEVYEFDAATGGLVCASCNPTGSRPAGVPAAQIDTANGGIAGGHQVKFPRVAANLPPWTSTISSATAIYQSRYLSDSGRLYFNANDALVSKDTNGTEDVYEYEPEGVPAGEHGCSSASESGSVTFAPARGVQVEGRELQEGAGCVALISSGESPDESAFLDATETGSEVFFLTSAELLPQDTDTSYDVYDARECSAASPCLPPPNSQPGPCNNEASCKAAPAPQPDIFAPSGSATFSGPGNLVPLLPAAVPVVRKTLTRAQKLGLALKACKKQKNRKKRASCEKKAHKSYGAKPKAKAKKTAGRRRSGR